MTEAPTQTILGIDPGTNLMGYGIVAVRNKKPLMLTMGVIHLSKFDNRYMRLHRIYERIYALVAEYHPTHVAIEAPFFGKNVQSMLKLGRAQGVAIAAVQAHGVGITEYEPRSIKMAITGNGGASKEQVREMLRRVLDIDIDDLDRFPLDATDALGAALCHYYESSRPIPRATAGGWKDFIARNPGRVHTHNTPAPKEDEPQD